MFYIDSKSKRSVMLCDLLTPRQLNGCFLESYVSYYPLYKNLEFVTNRDKLC